jgi:hypothetical protein
MSSLLDLLKPGWHRRIATATPATSATHQSPTAPTVATVATVAVANPEEIFSNDTWRYGTSESLQDIANKLDEELFEERAGSLEFGGGHSRADAELLAALDVIKAKGH